MKSNTNRNKAKQLQLLASLLMVGAIGATTAAGQVRVPTHGVTPISASKNPAVSTSATTPRAFVASPMTSQVTGSGITWTCDASIAADGPAGLCASLTTVISTLYNNTFANANASIYIEFNSAAGLGQSTTGFYNLVAYSTYQTALQSSSTGTAKAFVPAAEPAIFGTMEVELTSALAQALGITSTDDSSGTFGAVKGTTAAGAECFTPGSNGCYNGIIELNTPANLKAQIDQGYTYRSLGGSTTGTTDNYDFYSVVEHELDELLGSSSCVQYQSNGSLANSGNCVGAVDLFRYSGNGTRTFNTIPTPPTTAYFSPDGGVTDTEGNIYNTTSPGGDWADFTQSCVFVQDAGGCDSGILAANSFDITTDGPGGTAGPEIAIENAVGYNLSTNGPPAVVSVSPNTGSAATQTFTAVYSDPKGSADLGTLRLLLNKGIEASGGCYVVYTPATNSMSLENDGGTGSAGAITIPSTISVSNSQCTLSGTGTSVADSGNTVTVTYALTFTGSFSSPENIYLLAGNGSVSSGWVQKGTYMPPNGSPMASSVTPVNGTGTSQAFTATYNDSNGASDLKTARILFNSGILAAHGCYVNYLPSAGTMSLENDAGTGVQGTLSPGAGFVTNGQCTLEGVGSSVSSSGNTLTVVFNISFGSSFTATQNEYVLGGNANTSSGWVLGGTWTP